MEGILFGERREGLIRRIFLCRFSNVLSCFDCREFGEGVSNWSRSEVRVDDTWILEGPGV